jgi:hypothetical protein
MSFQVRSGLCREMCVACRSEYVLLEETPLLSQFQALLTRIALLKALLATLSPKNLTVGSSIEFRSI